MKLSDITKKELNPAQILVIGFALVILMGTILLSLPIASLDGKSVGVVNAFFTATSAVCVTGLVVVDTGTFWSLFGQIVIMLLIQIGGLGFMTLGTLGAMIIGRKITLKNRLIMQEALNQFTIAGVVRLTKYIVMMTLAIETIGAIVLSWTFIPIYGRAKGIFYGIFHSISAFCNAGFDLIGGGRSLTPFVGNIRINLTVMTLIIVGGIGFTVILDIIKNWRFRKLSLHSKFVLTITFVLLLSGFILFYVLEASNPETLGSLSAKDKVLAAMFQSVTPRTAGFNTIDLSKMHDSSKFLTTVFMFIGGSPGSTAGGIKTTTIGIIFMTVVAVIKGSEDIEFFKRRISKETINRALTVFGVALTLVLFITLLLSITEKGKDFLDIFFEAISAFGTVGLSLGITSSLSTLGKLIIAFTMFAGRVGPLTIIIAMANRKPKKALIRYPEGKISVG